MIDVDRQRPASPIVIHEVRECAIDCCVYCVIIPLITLIALSPLLMTAWGIKALYDRVTY